MDGMTGEGGKVMRGLPSSVYRSDDEGGRCSGMDGEGGEGGKEREGEGEREGREERGDRR